MLGSFIWVRITNTSRACKPAGEESELRQVYMCGLLCFGGAPRSTSQGMTAALTGLFHGSAE